MSFSIRAKKPILPKHTGVKDALSGEQHMDLVSQGLEPKLIFNGEKWVYGIDYGENIVQRRHVDCMGVHTGNGSEIINNSLLINETCGSFLRKYSTSQ